MSSYPPPSPMQYYSYPPNPGGRDPRFAARRASVLMFVLAGLFLTCGVAFAVMASVATPDMFAGSPEGQQLFQDFTAKTGIGVKTILVLCAIMVALPGLMFLVLAIIVRSGGRAVVITSLIANGGLLLLMMVQLLATGAQGQILQSLCVMAIPLGLIVATLISLAEANRQAGIISAQQQQYQMQMWQHQQQRQLYGGQPGQPAQSPYGGAGYGYGQGYGAPPISAISLPPNPAPSVSPPGPADGSNSQVRHPPLPPDPPAPPTA